MADNTGLVSPILGDYSSSPFKIDGNPVPAPRLNDCWEHNTVKRAWTDVDGAHRFYFIAQKEKFKWKYDAIDIPTLKYILNIIHTKFDNANPGTINSGDSFMITSWVGDGRNPSSDFVTVNCYLGGTVNYTIIAADNGVPTLASLELHWIQIPGGVKRGGA